MLDMEKLFRTCGISQTPTKKSDNWVAAEMRFIGADHYVLSTKRVAVSFPYSKDGMSLVIKGPVAVSADSLLGRKKVPGMLYDVLIATKEVTVSLAAIHKGGYPKVLRPNEMVEIT